METSATFEIVPPDDVPGYAYDGYFSCLHWAIGDEDVLDHFKSDTGLSYHPPKTEIEEMIDEATGHKPAEDFIRAFVPWFNVNIWGPWETV
jgi:hypothetical protein